MIAYFNLPPNTSVNRVVPKNAFDKYTNTRQKKSFTSKIERIKWTHKLSRETTNLPSGEVTELQIFKIELKIKEILSDILEVIDRAIPYHIIFWVQFEDEAYLSTSIKHPHPVNEDISVVDHTFTSSWFRTSDMPYDLVLKNDLDTAYRSFCESLAKASTKEKVSLAELAEREGEIESLSRKMNQLEQKIKRSTQFNKKVELNGELQEVKRQLKELKSPKK